MPVVMIDIPSGLTKNAKAQLHKDAIESMHHAYQMPDCRVYLRECAADQTSSYDVIGAAFRSFCHIIVLPVLTDVSSLTLVSRMSPAVNRACNLPTDVVKLPGGEEGSTQWVL